MKLSAFEQIEFAGVEFANYDIILLACGFEARSIATLEAIPATCLGKVVVLAFPDDLDKLSRTQNDAAFRKKGLEPILFGSALEYELLLKSRLRDAVLFAGKARPVRIFVDYSVMTRAWYGFILTWLKYGNDALAAEVDFAYAHGIYEGEFEPLRIEEVSAIPGFEGACAGSRSTVAAFGLGFDKYAALAVYEQIEPDQLICFLAQEFPGDVKTERALQENLELVDSSSQPPIFLPLGNLEEIYRIIYESFSVLDPDSEIVAVPMGPKPHVLGTMLVAQAIPRVTCLHAKGYRSLPVQVRATGTLSCWRLSYTSRSGSDQDARVGA